MKHERKGEFRAMRELLETSPAMRLIRDHDRHAALRKTWAEQVGEQVARQTRVTRYSGGRLTVEVTSAPLLLELSSFMKEELIGALRETEAFRGLVEISFRGGIMTCVRAGQTARCRRRIVGAARTEGGHPS